MLLAMNAKQQRIKINKLERDGYEILDELGIQYKPQYLIANKFCVDAFIPEWNIAVQFDGDYWHGHPEKFPNPDERQIRRMKLDRSQDAYLKKCGIRVIRIWESDVKNRRSQVRDMLQELILGPASPA